MTDDLLEAVISEVQRGHKYRHVHTDLIRNIAETELPKWRTFKEIVKAVRNKIHQVGAAYQPALIPYNKLLTQMRTLPNDIRHPAVKEFCRNAMRLHVSTRERLDTLDSFYDTCLKETAPVASLLDVACGLNPLAIPWMPLTADASVYACDIYTDQIDFLNQYFAYFQIDGKAFCCDLTREIPDVDTQLTLVLKTIPCLEQIDKHIGSRLLSEIRSRQLLVSFPAQSLGGRDKGMRQFYDDHFRVLVKNQGWRIQDFSFSNEQAYLVQK